ncbi:MAG TPA: hypothetical protein VKU01_27330 [Bryobacteraceae bacterium]|nr:hypothetical protein [Bryobacteraceae bacterium]
MTHLSGRERVSILLALCDPKEQAEFLGAMRPTGWHVETARSFDEALAVLQQSNVSVIVTQHKPGAGFSWLDLLEAAWRFDPAPRIIVTDRLADEALWAEVLNLGAFDLLMQPFEPEEVFRVITYAWRSWKEAARQVRRGAA